MLRKYPASNVRATIFKAIKKLFSKLSQLAFTFSKLAIETLEQGVKYVQS